MRVSSAGSVDQGALPGPWTRLLELGSQPEQDVFASRGGHELNADREAGVVPMQRKRDGGLAGDVEGQCEDRRLRESREQVAEGDILILLD